MLQRERVATSTRRSVVAMRAGIVKCEARPAQAWHKGTEKLLRMHPHQRSGRRLDRQDRSKAPALGPQRTRRLPCTWRIVSRCSFDGLSSV